MLLKDMNPRLRSMIINVVRKWFTYSDKYKKVKEMARVEKPIMKKDGSISKRKSVRYRCKSCKNTFKSGEVQVDHIITVVPLFSNTSKMSLAQYIQKVDCPISNLQLLCKECHKIKTKKENDKRSKTDRSGNLLKKHRKYKKIK